MESVKLSEAKAHLGRYARMAAKGADIVITDHNREMARLVGMPRPTAGVRPKVGLLDGQAVVPDDFDAPLESFERAFYGE